MCRGLGELRRPAGGSAGTPLAEATPVEILDLLAGGSIIELDNGWRLTMARIAGDKVVELALNGVPGNREQLRRYGLSEEIVGYKRRWFVAKDIVAAILPRLLVQRRAIRDVTTADTEVLVPMQEE